MIRLSRVATRTAGWLRHRCSYPAAPRHAMALVALAVGSVGFAGPRLGPYDILLFPSPATPDVQGRARLVFADSPFGIAVTGDGHVRYDVEITAAKLPVPASLGHFSTYVAWAATPELTRWQRLGAVGNGTTTVGPVDFNKFVLAVTAATDSASTSHDGPTVLHGTSPSGWLQQMLTQPEFHGVN